MISNLLISMAIAIIPALILCTLLMSTDNSHLSFGTITMIVIGTYVFTVFIIYIVIKVKLPILYQYSGIHGLAWSLLSEVVALVFMGGSWV